MTSSVITTVISYTYLFVFIPATATTRNIAIASAGSFPSCARIHGSLAARTATADIRSGTS